MNWTLFQYWLVDYANFFLRAQCDLKIPSYRAKNYRFGLNFTDLRETFESNEKCAIWIFPYLNINFSILNSNAYVRRHGKNGRLFNLLRKVYGATERPKFVKFIAEKFSQKTALGNDFIAIHWRLSIISLKM